MKARLVIPAACVLFLSIVLSLPVDASNTPIFGNSSIEQTDACREILTRAIQTLNNNCDQLSRNSACYGNDTVKAELISSATARFSTLGDKAPIQVIKTLTTMPMDTQRGTWGLSLLKLQANLPDTMPGQNVMFLVYGDTSVQNISGDMQAFYFSSGLSNLACKDAPRDGILVRSPNHAEVTFNANGVQVTIASTIYLYAAPNQSMEVDLVEGHARVTTPEGSQVLQAGEGVSIPLGGSNGLQAVGAPSTPVTESLNSSQLIILDGSKKFASPDAPVNVSIDGCISKIDGNIATISDVHVVIDPKNATLRNAKVGDCVRLTAAIQTGDDGTILIIPLAVKPDVRPAVPGKNGHGADGNPKGNAGGQSDDHGQGANNGNNGSMGDNGNPGSGNQSNMGQQGNSGDNGGTGGK